MAIKDNNLSGLCRNRTNLGRIKSTTIYYLTADSLKMKKSMIANSEEPGKPLGFSTSFTPLGFVPLSMYHNTINLQNNLR